MDINKYKESGILELFVLGSLSPEEEQQVLQHLKQYPALRAELEKIEEAMEAYGQANAITPPPNMEASILQQLDPVEGQVPPKPEESLPGSGRRINFNVLLTGIAVAASLALLTWGIFQNTQLKQQNTQIQALEDNIREMETACALETQQKEKAELLLALYKDPQTRPIELSGTDNAPEAIAGVLWNPNQQKTYLDIANLPAVPSNKQYQLWAIVDGTPVDMGVFDLVIGTNGDTFIEVPFIEEPQAFAITLEDQGGSQQPTLEEMVVYGAV